ncbi:DAHL domain-containing protein [Sphingomonas sp. BK235]|uniref:DAHL domain-containing protein n=1 Tax=Sphingomonas sp. BK235 TaxID=2512131 RepID=UPI001045BC66|nr:DAHL domain-containing protein [Sphingomonas sp. BK235]TCP33682.1 signal transduction histidine kinase [Sphingomonas sp. BK235]
MMLVALRCATMLAFVASIVLGAASLSNLSENRRWVVDASNAAMAYSLAERALQLDLLNARAGILRNYDPINADLAAERRSFADLQRLPLRPRARRLLAQLMTVAARQAQLVEQFKSDNALLQNSLTRFAAEGSAMAEGHDVLSSRIFKLTLDTSPPTVAEAAAALRRAPPAREGTPAAQLVAHARLLVRILPQIDGLLHQIRAMQMERRIGALEQELRAETRRRAEAARHLQIALAATIIVLIASVVALIIEQRLRTRELRAQAVNERLSAAIAVPLIDTGPADFIARVQDAVARLAQHIGARRLQLVIPGQPDVAHFSWPDAQVDPGWLRTLASAAEADGAWDGDRLFASLDARGVRRHLRRAMVLTDTADLVLLRTAQPHRVMLGFEPEKLAVAQRRDYLAGLQSAIVAIAHGARREAMQRERARLERTLARARRMEAIGAMASGVAHNFNNIIAAIGGFAEMGQERSAPGSAARYRFDEIRDAVERARELVDDILNFAKQGRSAKRPLNLVEVLDQAVRLLLAVARDEAAFRLVAVDRRLPVFGAAGELQQVILNICRNAAQASDGRAVTIEARRTTLAAETHLSHGSLAAGGYVVVAVSDSGPGVSESVRRRLFDPFFTSKAGGTGLGLSTAWEIVQDHGGTIDVQSGDAGGARFSVWLPVMRVDPGAPVVGDGARVLLLTEPDQLAAEEELLAEIGFEPLGFALATDPAVLHEVIGSCDAVVVAARDAPRAAASVAALGAALGDRQLLVATVGAIPAGATPLRYPLRADELAPLLMGMNDARETAAAD